ncbi:metallophosphoesterase [Stieleria sp. TO1_6]|uniref:metallophosphoesterase n=1 Tax=Stieleria tagensis TaxID=2956795 RepID=UPI00209B7B1D|nr:metallophosphoesterase [Stieleria tagensis]MCO8124357.1 metallophosphoesterase [Stieleria tagensis]
MNGFPGWLMLAIALVGHGGLHIAIYNRINAFGWPRRWIKRLVKLFLFTTVAIPIAIAWSQSDALREILFDGGSWRALDRSVRGYLAVCLASWVVFGIPWILWRPILGLESVAATRKITVVDVTKAFSHSLTTTPKATFESRLPLNQVLQLSIEEIELPVVGLPAELDGYRIAHLSDIHLTGEIRSDYARFAVQQATKWRPDLIALTGDIIDEQGCIDWLFEIFSPAEATDGCYFILGNHDTRIVDSWETRQAMDRAGWIDLGSQSIRRRLGGVDCQLIGNEAPWFARPAVEPAEVCFRLLLSHSPDQFGWARRNGIDLMLAGHTHGGQGRLPLAGPILSPSRHGSRYASGDFYRPPTTLHVTRGLGGVHLLRINCRPELSLLTLRVPS